MFYMVLDEWLADFAAGTQGSITVTLHPMNTISVAFSGATLPPSEITRRAATPRHARKDYRPNMTSIIDTAGIGAVNALSAFFEIQTKFGWETW